MGRDGEEAFSALLSLLPQSRKRKRTAKTKNLKAALVEEDKEDEEAADFLFYDTHLGRPIEQCTPGQTASTAEAHWPGIGDLKWCLFHAASQPPAVSSAQCRHNIKKRLLSSYDRLPAESKAFARLFVGMSDLMFTAKSCQTESALREAYCLHALNHVFRTRDRIIKNNERLQEDSQGIEARDQGFTRPKVLFVFPSRNKCAQTMDTLVQLSGLEQAENYKRFKQEYGMLGKETISSSKPAEFRSLFEGNTDDMFRLGLKVTRKSLKIFTAFYSSDMIFASPLGLRMLIGDEGSDKDIDFLSSIELVVIDDTEALLMQNWEHMERILKCLNNIPKEAHNCDFSRVRPWYLDGMARHIRQTLVFSRYSTPIINHIFTKHMNNVAGKAKLIEYLEGVIVQTTVRLQQKFQRIEVQKAIEDPEKRMLAFEELIKTTLDSYVSAKGTLVVVPSDLEAIKLRSRSSKLASAEYITEYSPLSDVSRARSKFASGALTLLVITERLQHYRRYRLQGVYRVIMYKLPENPDIYNELLGFVGDTLLAEGTSSSSTACTSLFSRWDYLSLERIAGSKRAKSMIEGAGDIYQFV